MPRGRATSITEPLVQAEIARLRWLWKRAGASTSGAATDVDLDALLGADAAGALDLFDRLQLEAVLRVCREARSVVNDADRLRKYVAKFGLDWRRVAQG